MDWLPTLRAAAGTGPDPSSPADGMSLLPHLAPGAPTAPRTLYWRYLSKEQKAVRDGDWKVLDILGHTFLFDVVADPLERANLKGRHPDVYARLVAQWTAWNATMLRFGSGVFSDAFSDAFSGADLADPFGAPPTIAGDP